MQPYGHAESITYAFPARIAARSVLRPNLSTISRHIAISPRQTAISRAIP